MDQRLYNKTSYSMSCLSTGEWNGEFTKCLLKCPHPSRWNQLKVSGNQDMFFMADKGAKWFYTNDSRLWFICENPVFFYLINRDSGLYLATNSSDEAQTLTQVPRTCRNEQDLLWKWSGPNLVNREGKSVSTKPIRGKGEAKICIISTF